MAGMSNIISGAILLVIVIGIYVAVTYMRNKKIGGNGGCDGNCSACTMHHGNECDDSADNSCNNIFVRRHDE